MDKKVNSNLSHEKQKVRDDFAIKINSDFISAWGKFKQKVSNLKNYMKYNLIDFNSSILHLNNYFKIRIFDKEFDVKSQADKLEIELKFIIYFSYRSDFYPIEFKDELWTTDCGWGCMIRASQMMLSRAIYLIKLSEISLNKEIKEEFYDENSMRSKVCNETIFLFLETFQEISKNGFSSSYPEFSIYNICKLGLTLGKSPGQWFSDVNMVNIFSKINKSSKTIRNTEIITFNDNLIEEEDIIKTCFKEKNCECKIGYIKCECLKIKDKYYSIQKNGIIFVSSRVGLDSIDPQYYTPIIRLFSIKNNLGLIGGKGNYALYFIGVTGDNHLIHLDPHLNQSSIKSINKLYEPRYQQTYLDKKFYFLNIKYASPAFTFGLYFTNVQEFKQIQYTLKLYSKMDNPIIKYKALDSYLAQEINDNINNKDEVDYKCIEEDDFCVISK